MEEEETQLFQIRDSDDDEDLIPQFKIMSLRDGKHRKVQLQSYNSNNKSDIRKQQQNLMEQKTVTNYYQSVNTLLYDLKKDYLEKVEIEKKKINEE
ncbi:unnamed protein product (macronuclear) [Paramecium tetraurelia]|uniref:Uncharacterized protein n=1 Tax=Paramecium tetraurelia TaxID=5888 RepID=A0EFL3_PARTE|nr:uncharacterized protein GSPATT00026427001 [Paramecium tetraurelia]CAK94104.1 unnamed protein product [Paramecium tetraurelia]|eukprot:XP_001461477.1 hypothetical protein (macronuclear) [Paramecium tetraurelia strain d4-2]